MCNLIVILLFLNLQVLTLDALCNHTDRSLSSKSLSFQPSKATNITANNSSQVIDLSDSSIYLHKERTIPGQELSLDKLRLEYYKYRIVSHLDISANPDKLNPDLDDELKNRIKLSRSHEKLNTPVINSRHKRSLACSEVKSDKNACCLETFYVNFTEIGWDKWILYPTGYNANYCRGQCDLSHARYYHSTLLSKFSSVIGLCCSPRQMAPLRLLYIDENNKVLQKTVPDMIVESCDCA